MRNEILNKRSCIKKGFHILYIYIPHFCSFTAVSFGSRQTLFVSGHSYMSQNTHLIAIEAPPPVSLWPLAPRPRRLTSADCLLSCCKNFIEFI